MADLLLACHLDAALGGLLLVYIVYTKLDERRWRRAGLRVRATVVAVYPHMHATSYFFRYSWEGRERTAQYNGPPLRTRHRVGDDVEILVQTNAPEVSIPSGHPNDPAAMIGEGNCRPVESNVFTIADLVYSVAGVMLIYFSIRRR